MASHDSNPAAPTTTTTAYGADSVSSRKRRFNVSDPARNNLVAFLAEFVGTFMFLFLAFAGTQVANNLSTLPTPDVYNPSVLILISLSFGFSLLANVWAFYRVSGGLFNPAVSCPIPSPPDQRTTIINTVQVALALYLVGGISLVRAILVAVAQILGGLAAASLVSGLFPGPLKVATSLGPDTSVAQGLFIEMFLTAELVFVVIMLAAEKHQSTHMAPVGIGIAFFVTQLTGKLYQPFPLSFSVPYSSSSSFPPTVQLTGFLP
jgi:aquaporin related protein